MKKILLLTVMMLLSSQAFADMIHLKNGRTLEGEIIEKTDTYVSFRLKSFTAKYDLKDVESVEKASLPEDFYGKKEIAPAPAVKRIPGTDAIQAEGYSAPEGSAFNMSTKAIYRKLEGRDLVEVAGETNLPNGSTIYVALKLKNNIIDSLQLMVVDHKFTARFGPFVNKLPNGDYTVEAVYLQGAKAKDKKTAETRKESLKTVCVFPVGKSLEKE